MSASLMSSAPLASPRARGQLVEARLPVHRTPAPHRHLAMPAAALAVPPGKPEKRAPAALRVVAAPPATRAVVHPTRAVAKVETRGTREVMRGAAVARAAAASAPARVVAARVIAARVVAARALAARALAALAALAARVPVAQLAVAGVRAMAAQVLAVPRLEVRQARAPRAATACAIRGSNATTVTR